MSNFNYKKLTPFKWFVLENFPFIEADFDALTDWQLLCKLGNEINKIINSTNTLGTQVEDLTNYFNNLDVQEEINNKLDEMAESGELEEIIAQYLNSTGILCFNSVADMKNSDNLINGSFCKTFGYYTFNDGGQGLYKIRNIKTSDIIDNGLIIPIDENLIAELIFNNTINIKQFGAKGNNETDDTLIFQNAINNVPDATKIIIPNGKYILSNKLSLPDTSENKYIILEGQNRDTTELLFNIQDDNISCAIEMLGSSTSILNKCIIKNLKIKNIKENDISSTNGINLGYNMQINCLENISISGFYDNIDLGQNNWSFTLYHIRSLNARNNGVYGWGVLNNIHFVGCDIMDNKNANIYLRSAMNCSIENTDFSVYNHGVYGIYLYYCNSINILNCYYESAENCDEILSGIYAEQVQGLTINSLDSSINAIKENYSVIHLIYVNGSVISGFNLKNTSSQKCSYGIYYESSYNNQLNACYFTNVKTCVYITLSNVILAGGMHISYANIIKSIETSTNGLVSGYIRNDVFEKSQINQYAKPSCHLIGINAITVGTTADRPYVFSVGQIYRDTSLNKIIFGASMPTFDENGQVTGGNTWVDVDNVIV